jgi:hypothetical protein
VERLADRHSRFGRKRRDDALERLLGGHAATWASCGRK